MYVKHDVRRGKMQDKRQSWEPIEEKESLTKKTWRPLLQQLQNNSSRYHFFRGYTFRVDSSTSNCRRERSIYVVNDLRKMLVLNVSDGQ